MQSEREDALTALGAAHKQLQQASKVHKEAVKRLNESKELAVEEAINEKTFLENILVEKEAQLDDITKQLCDKASSLEAMQTQARKREQILSNLRHTLQYRGRTFFIYFIRIQDISPWNCLKAIHS